MEEGRKTGKNWGRVRLLHSALSRHWVFLPAKVED